MTNPTQPQIDKLTVNLTRWDDIVNGTEIETVDLDSFTVKTLAGYLTELSAVNPTGNWLTSTAYVLQDLVVESTTTYLCVIPHTSGTFSTDLAAGNWVIYQLDLSQPITFLNNVTVYKNESSNVNFFLENDFINAGNLIQFDQVTDGAETAPKAFIGHGGDATGDFIINSFNTGLILKTNDTSRMTIDKNGLVGIGTTAPQQDIHIFGSQSFIRFSSTTTGVGSGTNIGVNADGDFLIENKEAQDIIMKTSDTTRLTIDQNGLVGIGTTTPNATLEILNSTPSIRLTDSDSTVASNVWQPSLQLYASDGQIGFFGYGGSDDLLISNFGTAGRVNFRTQNTTRMSIDPDGLVGIGTSSPNEALEIASSVANIRLTDSTHNLASLNFHNQLQFYASDGKISSIGFNGTDVLNISNTTASGDMTFRTDNIVRLNLDSAGDFDFLSNRIQNVSYLGINTDDDSEALIVSGGIGSAEVNKEAGILVTTHHSTEASNNEFSSVRLMTPAYNGFSASNSQGLEIVLSENEGHAYISTNINDGLTNSAMTFKQGTGDIGFRRIIGFHNKDEKTIASGAITITKSFHTVDTEGDAATDDLTDINGAKEGDTVYLLPANGARTIVVKSGLGNIELVNGDFTMDDAHHAVHLLYDGNNWKMPNVQ